MNAHDGYIWPLITLVLVATGTGFAIGRRAWEFVATPALICIFLFAVIVSKVTTT